MFRWGGNTMCEQDSLKWEALPLPASTFSPSLGSPSSPPISHELPKQEIIAAFRSSRLFPPPNLVSNYSQRNL